MIATAAAPVQKKPSISPHVVGVTIFTLFLFGIVTWCAIHGFSYYKLSVSERAFHPDHLNLRPAGTIGIRLGLLAVLIFVIIYAYPFRKKHKFLRFMGSTKSVLDYHIVMGLAVPFIVALHAAFKFRGLAGLAFWIMMSVVLSGVVGRYLYAQIPRTRKDTEFTQLELEQMNYELGAELESQNIKGLAQLERLTRPLPRETVRQMSLMGVIFYMFLLDLRRPIQVAALRRKNLRMVERVLTLGGFLPSSHKDLEKNIAIARKQAWLSAKIFFLDRAAQIFQLWHVVHRPFSYAFLVLAALHVGMVLWMGFV